jgi:type I restriction enzyme M protein
MSPKGGIKPHKKFSIQAKRSEVLFVDYIAEHLNPNGRGGVIVPEGIIFQSGIAYKKLRKMLIETSLYAVVSLPAGVFNPYSGVKTSILFLNKNSAKKTDKILFIKVRQDGFGLGAQRRKIKENDLPLGLEIINRYKQSIIENKEIEFNLNESKLAHVVNKEKIAENGDYNLSSDRYKETVIYNGKWDFVELGEIFKEIRNGKNVKQILEKGKYRVTRIQTIADGSINLNNTRWTNDDVSENDFMQSGDILVSHINSYDHLGKAALFYGISSKVVHGINLLKFKPDKQKINPFYAIFIFKSEKFLKKVKSFAQRAVNQASVKTTDLKRIKIPLPPLEIQEQIVAELDSYQKILDGAKQVVENYKPTFKIDPEWEITELEKVAEIISGQSPKGKYYNQNGEGLPFYQGKKEFTEMYISKPKKWTSQITKISEKGDILMSVRAPVGPVNLSTQKICIGRGLAAIRSNKKIEPMYLFNFLKTIEASICGNGGSVFDSISNSQIKKIKIPLPPLKIQKDLAEQFEKVQTIINANKELITIFEKKIKDKIGEVWGEKK